MALADFRADYALGSEPLLPRAATTSDAFNAVAEPRRRDILNYLALQERPVWEFVATLGLEQPSVSKHLRVLRDVGLGHVRRDRRRMLYRTNAEAIRPLHEWASTFERLWQHQLSRVKVASGALLQQDAPARPSFAAPIYGGPFGVMPAIPAKLPPIFLAWAQDDALALSAVIKFYDSLKSAGYKPEAHIFSAGGHGFGMRKQGTSSDHWIDEFYYWLEAQGFTRPAAT
jgi:DNA-binding transcriptional ArsR family regulator